MFGVKEFNRQFRSIFLFETLQTFLRNCVFCSSVLLVHAVILFLQTVCLNGLELLEYIAAELLRKSFALEFLTC